MNRKKLKKLRHDLLEIRRSPQGRKPAEFISIASQLGRIKDSRGKEPTYVRQSDPALSPPLSIPNHGDLKIGTARSIIDALLNDVDDWEIFLQKAEDEDTRDDDAE